MAVTHVQITKRYPFADGTPFGDVGPYERIDGVLQCAVSPEDPHNALIVDLDKAIRDGAGRVHFEADFTLVQPALAERSNGRLLVNVPNRGCRNWTSFNRAARSAEPTEEIDPGDGFLMRHGWSVASIGWQWDVSRGPALVGLGAPEALDAQGKPLSGEIVCEFQVSEPEANTPLSNRGHTPYPARDLHEAEARLYVRDWPDAPRSLVPRPLWRFARMEGGRFLDDPTCIWIEGGFQPGRIYEAVYTTERAPVVGSGLLAFRDGAAFLRNGSASISSVLGFEPQHVYATGRSQSGRFLRHFLLLALNLDEQDRQVFDGLHIHVAGARQGEFNHRFAQPSVADTPSFAFLPPYNYDDLLARHRALGGVPRIFATNTSCEYWNANKACSFLHIDPDSQTDLEPPPEVRTYLYAGTEHVSGIVPPAPLSPFGERAVNTANTVDYSLLDRAALINLDTWAAEGVEPPASAYPRLGEGTATHRNAVIDAFARFPGVALPLPDRLPIARTVDVGPDAARGVGRYPAELGKELPMLVAAVDADGNELGAIRSPDVAVPLATYTGWNPRHPATGGEGQIINMLGTTLPFSITAADRIATGDPRPAIFERYQDRADYLARVQAAAEALAADRYILTEDIDVAVEIAAERFDWLVPAQAQSQPAGTR